MSGHSKWSSIKHRKARTDAVRGKLFGRLQREMTVAARVGGGDPDTNARLRTAIRAAKSANMPRDNIERAIKKGTGELPGTHYEEAVYEGYGSAGVAFMVDVLSDNKNRTTAELKKVFSKAGGHLGEAGCVAWMFKKKGMVVIEGSKMSEEELMEFALEVGADDMRRDGDSLCLVSSAEDFEQMRQKVAEKGIEPTVAEISHVPESTVLVEGKDAERVIRLAEALEEHDDVQHVYANFEVPAEVMEKMAS